MKKFLYLFEAASLIFSINYASANTTPTFNQKNDEVVGRQCCTKTIPTGGGSTVSITACAGSFLTSDAKALAKACEKVIEAMQDL